MAFRRMAAQSDSRRSASLGAGSRRAAVVARQLILSTLVVGVLAAAAALPGALRAEGELYRCEARDAFTIERGVQQRGSTAAALRAAIDPLLVDTHTGAVRFGATQLNQWSVQQRGGAASDFVAEGGTAADGLWIRVWEKPASFVLVQNSTNVVTGVCVVAE
jgi:hypothetical protein